jgi:protein-S-isoprenylcysteine O-methyltransferase Ste14
MSGLPSLGPRGEGWVAIQVVLLVAIALVGWSLGGAWTGAIATATAVLGGALIVIGGVLAVRGVIDLREALTPLPHPRAGATLVESGVYAGARHPIYGGLIVTSVGWGLATASPAALGLAAVLAGFFTLKSIREEAWLERAYPGYPDYRRRTRRFIPWPGRSRG